MQKRMLIYFCFMISYSGALLHSVTPHHHHSSIQEATSHHHHHAKAHSHHDSQNKDDKKDSEPYFLSHVINADILTNHSIIEKPVKTKKIDFDVIQSRTLKSFYAFNRFVFHPPQNDRLRSQFVYFSSSLRGPPSIA